MRCRGAVPRAAVHLLFVFGVPVCAASCSNPTGPVPPPPPPAAPAIQCPVDIAADALNGTSAVVSYDPPKISGGSVPVTTACTIASGATLPPGTTDVTCTATDAIARTSQCVFRISVTAVPRLKGTRILAFGDSITAGEVSPPVQSSVHFLDVPNSYPSVLNGLLTARYKAQTITVLNEGISGERVLVTGEGRIEQLVVTHRPDVLIILEGVNGLNDTPDAPEEISEALRRGVRRAVAQGVPLVLVSTILPGVPGRPKAPKPDAVIDLNAGIRFWASRERAVLVDSYEQFNPMKEVLIGEDGLHPTIEGYRKLAEIFGAAIRTHFEETAPAGPAGPSGWRSGRLKR